MGGYSTGPGSVSFVDASSTFVDDADPTKKAALQLSGITTATTRTLTLQDASGTIYITGGIDVAVADGGTGASTAAGAATNLGLGTTDAVVFKSLDLYDTTSLGSESLAETAFTTETKWTDTADFAIASNVATYTHSGGTGTITQTSANLATALVGDSWYRFQYDISGVTGTAPAVTITTGIAASAQSLVISNGTNKTIDFKTKVTPGNFVISVTSSVAGVFVLDNVSLKQITGGALTPGAPLSVVHGGTGVATSTGTGSVVLSTSPALVTPSLGVASATSIALGGGTALANYLENTFAPTFTLVGGAGNTVPVYSTNTGRYTRIGNRVFVDVLLTGDGGAEGAGTGLVAIALPIAISASAPVNTINRPIGTAYNNASYYYILGEFIQSASTVRLYYETLFTAQTSFTGAEQNNANRAILLSFNYEV